MKLFQLILKEAFHRKLNFLLSLLAIVTAVALFAAFLTTARASKRETTRLMRDIGYNLRILPKETDMERFWLDGFSEYTMPEEYVERFAMQENFSYSHLLAILQQRVRLQDREVVLTGIGLEVSPPDRKKPSMIFTIEEGTVTVGFEIARSLGIQEDDVIEFLGQPFTVVRCLPESGSNDDIRVYGNLRDVQRLLNMEGEINEIKALECVCLTSDEDPLTVLRTELAAILPDAKVIQMEAIATARREQRLMIENYFAWIIPLVLVVCAVWVGALAMMNVRERRYEIGVLRSLGYGSWKIASIFLGKAVVIGMIGALLGFGIGTTAALSVGPDIFKVTAKMIRPAYALLGWALLVAPMFAALSSFIPTMIAVTQDPALTLREE